MTNTKRFIHKGIIVIYDANYSDINEIISIVDNLLEKFHKDLKNVETIDFSEYDLTYPIIDGKVYEYNGHKLKRYIENK